MYFSWTDDFTTTYSFIEIVQHFETFHSYRELDEDLDTHVMCLQ